MNTHIKKHWEILEAYEWTKKRRYIRATQKIVKIYGYEETKKAWSYADKLFSALWESVSAEEDRKKTRFGEYGGDDSFGDMLWHVIGSGEEFYHKVLKCPYYLDGFKYKESFQYCSHYFLEEGVENV